MTRPPAVGTFLPERVHAMCAAGHGANLISLVLALLVLVVMGPFLPVGPLVAWTLALALALVLRWQLLRIRARDYHADQHATWWARRLTWTMGLSGAAWGAGGALFYLPEQPLLMAFWAIMVCGIGAGAVHATAYYLPAQRAYLLPLLLPLTLRHAWDAGLDGQAHLEHGGIALGMAAYMLSCLGQGRRQARLLLDSLAMRHEKDQLLLALQAQSVAAESARARAEEAALSKARFFAAASHDLRQPLQALGMFAQALRQSAGTPDHQPLIEQIGASVDALDKLFDGILGIARLDAGAAPHSPSCWPWRR